MSTSVTSISVSELCEREELSPTLLVQLVEYEIARPLAGESSEDWIFDVSGAHWINRALRLRRDLELDWAAVAMLVDLLRERERLQAENACLRQRLARFLVQERA
jgi:chaperone modulatory protein CbpM